MSTLLEHLHSQLTAAIKLQEAGFTRLAQNYWADAALTAQAILQPGSPAPAEQALPPAIQKKIKAFLAAWQSGKTHTLHRRAAALYNSLLDQRLSPLQYYGPWLTALALCALIAIGGRYFYQRLYEPAIAEDTWANHANYLAITAQETPKRKISSWIELGRSEPGVSRYKRYGSAYEFLKISGFTDASWGHLTYPPTVNWYSQSLNDNGELVFYFDPPDSPLGKTVAVSLFFTDGDIHYSVPRTVRVKTGANPFTESQLVSSLHAGVWVDLPVSAEEQLARKKTVKLTRLTGNNIAVSAAVFWHEKP